MKNAILNFPRQLEFEPKIINVGKLKKYKKFLVAGMGGSHWAADLLISYNSKLDIIIYSNYGLPEIPVKSLKDRLIVCSSYSGNTDEAIDVFKQAIKKKLPLAVITVGGELLKLAQKYKVPYIQIPNTGIQPRCALGFSIIAMMKLMGLGKELSEIKKIAPWLKTENASLEKRGKFLAQKMEGYIPLIYASAQNYSLAWNWKIKLNETGKVPAFANVFPELNHNELNGFDGSGDLKKLCQNFYVIFLKDAEDNKLVQKRLRVTEKIYHGREMQTEIFELKGKNRFHKMFSSLLLADWVANYTAIANGLDPEQVPMVEEFKRLMKK